MAQYAEMMQSYEEGSFKIFIKRYIVQLETSVQNWR